MPFSSSDERKSPPKPWAVIDPAVPGDDSVRINFTNPTGHVVKFIVDGVLPKSMVIELDGATSWTSQFTSDPKAFRINVRQIGSDKLLASQELLPSTDQTIKS